MVVLQNFSEVFNESSLQNILSLPPMKLNYLRIVFENHDFQNNVTVYNGSEPPLPFASSGVFNASPCKWRRLTADHVDCKAVYEVTFDVTGSNLNFRPGDTIGIIGQNLDMEVSSVIAHLNLTSVVDCWYNLSINSSQKGAKIPAHVPIRSTLRHVLTHCVDFRGVIKKLFLLSLSRYTQNENEKKVLEYLSSKEGATSYTTHILNKNLCILDLFEILKTCTPPVEVILEHLPRLLPRPYSIINSSLKNRNELKICFSVMKVGNNRKGLVTGWLEEILNESSLEEIMKNISITDKKGIKLNNKIPIYMRKNLNNFSFHENCSRPILLIGPGTGVAPYIGFLEDRNNDNKTDQSIVWLFFGCRNPNLDYIYKEELQNFVDTGVLNKLTTAFSRVENCQDKYIQDAILRNGEEVTKLIKEGALVYVCGNVKKMDAQVKETLVKCLVYFGLNTQEEAEQLIGDMQKDKRYLVDSWN